jgi:hypothetical protein
MTVPDVLKTYRYKLVPNAVQKRRLSETVETCRELYNLALEQRRGQLSKRARKRA